MPDAHMALVTGRNNHEQQQACIVSYSRSDYITQCDIAMMATVQTNVRNVPYK